MEACSPATGEGDAIPGIPADLHLARICSYVSERTRLSFAGHKQSVLRQRLRGRLLQLDLPDYRAYWEHLLRHPDEECALFDILTTNETSFFRNPQQFWHLRDVVLPELELARGQEALRSLSRSGRGGAQEAMKLRILCAGCSTGEEPYSAAMMLLEALRYHRSWDLRIVAGDLSQSSLETARAGFYETARLRGIPPELQEKYLTARDGGAVVSEELRRIVEFHPLNLHDLMEGGSPPGCDGGAGFDIIFCRNVMIYFSPSSQQQLVETLYRLLAPGGYLLTGDAEPLHLFSHDFVTVRDAGCLIYQKRRNENAHDMS